MPGVSRRSHSTRCSFCFRAFQHLQFRIAGRTPDLRWVTVYRLCQGCGNDTLRRLAARPRGILA